MAYSSIAHLGGMLAASSVSNTLTTLYLIIYIVLSLTTITIFAKTNFNITTQCNQLSQWTYALIIINLLSLGGLPPFLGFTPKWVLINTMLPNNLFMPTILVLTSLITLFFYLRLSYSAFLISKSPTSAAQKPTALIIIISTISIWALPVAIRLN
jgi:NADH-ubiquinone oxidoreductase chain 2